jgi:hypothetical protein
LPTQFQARILIKGEAINIDYCETGLIQAISEGGHRECLVVLYLGKPLLLSGCENSAALHQATGRVVVSKGYAYDVQKSPRKLYADIS